MNQITPTDDDTRVVVIPRETALSVLTDAEQFDAFYARIKAEVDAHVPDVTTQKGRDAIKSLAFKVVKTKTAIDAAGKGLTEEWRKNTATVDASRKKIRDQLDALRDEVRKPVTDWEEAEEKRVAEIEATLARLNAAAIVSIEDTVETVSTRLIEVEAVEITDEHYQDHAPAARARQESTKTTLEAALVRLRQEAADRAELERLRKEADERQAAEQRREHARSIIQHIRDCGNGTIGGQPQPLPILLRELQEKVAIDASFGDLEDEARQVLAETLAKLNEMGRLAEEQRERDAQERRRQESEAQARREQEAAQRAAQEAETRAREESEAKAREERDAQERAHQEQLAAERRATEAAQAEAKRLADEKAAADAQAAEAKAAAEKRAADIAHKGKILGEAKVAIMAAGGVGEAAAKAIVLAITAGTIPHTTITF